MQQARGILVKDMAMHFKGVAELPDIDSQIDYVKTIRQEMSEKEMVEPTFQMIIAIEQTLLAARVLCQPAQIRQKSTPTYDYTAILIAKNIKITSVRLSILKAIMTFAKHQREMSLSDIHNELPLECIPSKSAIISTIILFKSRGIIRYSLHNYFSHTKRRQGRPEKRFRLNPEFEVGKYRVE